THPLNRAFFFPTLRPPPRPTLFPYTTLFRSDLEQALLVAVGAGERAAHMAEELGLEQVLGQGAAVERHHRLVAAERVEVNRLRRSEEHTSELQSPCNLVCRLLLEKKKSARNS